jgi:hypothetical protein
MFARELCTVYNRFYDPTQRKYIFQPTEIEGIFWQEAMGAKLTQGGVYEANEVHVFIPFSAESHRVFATPEEFQEEPTDYFTLRPEDKIMRGVSSGKRLTILSVNTFDYGSKDLQHWEVVAK